MGMLSDMHGHVESVQDDQAPEQDVTDDAEGTVVEHVDKAPEHDVMSVHETAMGMMTIESSSAEDIDSLEEDTQEEDLTEAVVEPHDDDDDTSDAHEVADQISLDEPYK